MILVELVAAADIGEIGRFARAFQNGPWRSNWPESESELAADFGCGRGGDTARSGGSAFRVIGVATTAVSVVIGALAG